MSSKYVLTIDAGSSGCRAIIFDSQGRQIFAAYQEWRPKTPAGAGSLVKEFDPATLWQIVCRLVVTAISRSGTDPEEIAAVCATSQRQGVVFLDANGCELYVGPNTDLRALIEGFSIDAEFGDRLLAITGHYPPFMFTPAKLKWFEKHRPQIYERIYTVLTINNWITYRLCGRLAAEASSDADTGMLDVSASSWSQELMTMLDLPAGIFPDILPAGTCAGKITPSAAADSGLSLNTLVAIGGGDTQCGLLGMGMIEQGQLGIVAGWSASLQMVLHQPQIDSIGRIWTGCHVLPERWVLESNAAECGGSYAWLKQIFFGNLSNGTDPYAHMDRLAQETPRGAEGVLAFIGPRTMDMKHLRPLLGGFVLPITPTVTDIQRKHLVRAAMENICFAFRSNRSQLEDLSGLKTVNMAMGGGLARSKALLQIAADVLQIPVIHFDNPEVSSRGAAMCAATAAGLYPDLPTACLAMLPQPCLAEPDPSAADEYQEFYYRWKCTAERLNEQ